jgi:hypothetical protein
LLVLLEKAAASYIYIPLLCIAFCAIEIVAAVNPVAFVLLDEDVIPVKDDNFLSPRINPVVELILLYVLAQSILYFLTLGIPMVQTTDKTMGVLVNVTAGLRLRSSTYIFDVADVLAVPPTFALSRVTSSLS